MKNRTLAAAGVLTAAMLTAMVSGQAQAASPQRLMVSNVTASSTLPSESGYSYDVWNIVDHDPTTCWTEGVAGDGVGEYIDIYIPKGTVVTGALVYPGYYADQNRFDKNGAPTMLTFSSSGASIDQYMTAYGTTYQSGFEGCYFNLTSPIVSDGKIRVKIGKVRTGSKYQDTCISELYLYGYTDAAENGVDEGTDDGSYAGTDSPANGSDDVTMGDGGGVIASEDLWRLGTLAQYLLQPLWDGSGSITLNAQSLTSSQRAFALYWYQYNCADIRVKQENDSSGMYYHRLSYEDACGILTDLFGENVDLESDLRVFKNNYIEDYNGYSFKLLATGDFGDAGEYYLAAPNYSGMQNGQYILSGSVMRYDSNTAAYREAQEYTMYVSAEGTNRSGNGTVYAFKGIEVRDRK